VNVIPLLSIDPEVVPRAGEAGAVPIRLGLDLFAVVGDE
jgi:hypothetical protein